MMRRTRLIPSVSAYNAILSCVCELDLKSGKSSAKTSGEQVSKTTDIGKNVKKDKNDVGKDTAMEQSSVTEASEVEASQSCF